MPALSITPNMRVFIALTLVGSALAAPHFDRRQAVDSSASIIAATSVASSAVSAVSSASAASASAATSASASSATDGFLAAIRARGANQFATLLEANPAVLNSLGSAIGPNSPVITAFLPVDLSNVNGTTQENSTLFSDLVNYHIVGGNVTSDSIAANSTQILQTALTNYRNVSTPQVLVASRDQYLTTRIVGASNATVLANSTYQNVLFRLINQALVLPTNVSTTLSSIVDASTLYGLAAGLPQLVQTVDSAQAITVFAPTNEAIASSGLASTLANADNNTVQQVISQHVISNQTLFSTQIQDGASVNNAAGSQTQFVNNATGVFVTAGGVTAQVVRTDINAANGVVHLINKVLFTAPTNASTATSAASSASSTIVASSAAISAASTLASVASAATSAVATPSNA